MYEPIGGVLRCRWLILSIETFDFQLMLPKELDKRPQNATVCDNHSKQKSLGKLHTSWEYQTNRLDCIVLISRLMDTARSQAGLELLISIFRSGV
jgi:hypothetical protein